MYMIVLVYMYCMINSQQYCYFNLYKNLFTPWIIILYYNFKQAEAEKERKQKEEAARNQMKPASTDSEESDDELDIELKRLVCYRLNFRLLNSSLLKCNSADKVWEKIQKH